MSPHGSINRALAEMPARPSVSSTAGPTSAMATLALTLFLHSSALGQDFPNADSTNDPIEFVVKQPLSPLGAQKYASIASATPRGERLAKSIAAAANQSLLQSGVEIAKEAVLECQKGDYPGGGMGLMSMPFGRPTSRTDHCFR